MSLLRKAEIYDFFKQQVLSLLPTPLYNIWNISNKSNPSNKTKMFPYVYLCENNTASSKGGNILTVQTRRMKHTRGMLWVIVFTKFTVIDNRGNFTLKQHPCINVHTCTHTDTLRVKLPTRKIMLPLGVWVQTAHVLNHTSKEAQTHTPEYIYVTHVYHIFLQININRKRKKKKWLFQAYNDRTKLICFNSPLIIILGSFFLIRLLSRNCISINWLKLVSA